MTAMLQCMSHSPLIAYTAPRADIAESVERAFEAARQTVKTFDPELVVVFFPDHYNGFFYDNMPQFCIGHEANAIGDYQTPAGPVRVPKALAGRCAAYLLEKEFDVAVSHRMALDHGVAQPLDILFGGLDKVDTIPVFLNSVAAPLAKMSRVIEIGTAVGEFLRSTKKRVLIIGSGGLSHDPPIPKISEVTGEKRERLLAGRNLSPADRELRQSSVIEAGRVFSQEGAEAAGIQPLNPKWDREIMRLLAADKLASIRTLTTEQVAVAAGNSAHEVRTWVAAFSAIKAFGEFMVTDSFYEPIEEWIVGFGMITACVDGVSA